MPENRPPALTDAHTIRLVIVFAFLLALLCIGGGLYLDLSGHKADGEAVVLISAGTGTIPALFALLARTSTAPAPVSVANTPADPVPVAQTPTPAAPAAEPTDPPT